MIGFVPKLIKRHLLAENGSEAHIHKQPKKQRYSIIRDG